jgi:Microtubule binding
MSRVDIYAQNPEVQGMIPRAVEKVFQVTEELRWKGWEYRTEGQFLEIVCGAFDVSQEADGSSSTTRL